MAAATRPTLTEIRTALDGVADTVGVVPNRGTFPAWVDGPVYIARRGFYYTHGSNADDFTRRVTGALQNLIVLDAGHWWVRFVVGPQAAAQTGGAR